MKLNKWIFATITIFSLVLLFTGCPQTVDPVSVSERMNMFIADANAEDYGSLKGHTHPDATAYTLANSTYWDAFFLGGTEMDMALSSISGSTAIVSGVLHTFTFYLKEDDKDVYKIYRITGDGHTTFE